MTSIMRLPRKRYLILFFVIFIILVRYVSQIGPEKSPADRFKVVNVIDGDTVDLTGGDRVRLLGIDAPENGEPYSDSARALLANLIMGKSVELVYSHRQRDNYGRLLAYLYLDSVFICREIVRRGLASLYLFEDNLADQDRIDELQMVQNEAIDSSRGIWTVPHRQERFYLAKKGSYRFHRPGCNSVRTTDAAELIRFDKRSDPFRLGLSPCRNCKP